MERNLWVHDDSYHGSKHEIFLYFERILGWTSSYLCICKINLFLWKTAVFWCEDLRFSSFISKINEYESCQQAFKLLKSKCEWSNSIAELSLKKKEQNWKHKTFMCFTGLVQGWGHVWQNLVIDECVIFFNTKYYWDYGSFPLIFLSPTI